MLAKVKSFLGLAGVPSDRSSASEWLHRRQIKVTRKPTNGGHADFVELSTLPVEVQHAIQMRDLLEGGLAPGTRDDEAHRVYEEASPKARARAETRAAMARVIVSLRPDTPWVECEKIIRKRFALEGVSTATLKRIAKQVEGVDPINFAPALLPGYRPGKDRVEITDDAWRYYLTQLRDAAPTWPLRSAYADVVAVGKMEGWTVPSFSTFNRRWLKLTEAERHTIRHGRADTIKRFTQPVRRDKTTLKPMEVVSLDGRTLDFWVDFGDGKAKRPTMLALVDVATNMILGYELSDSENAAATVHLIVETCRRHGIFQRLYTDNGSAFAGHVVAGGSVEKGHRKAADGAFKPLGVCDQLGIEVTFALPGNAQAKIAERTFATLSRVVDDRPELRDAHSGHAPGASPSVGVSPVSVETVQRVLRREVARHNAAPGRRSQGANGRSYAQVFEDGLIGQLIRRPTANQLYMAGLIYKPVAVDRNGQVHIDGYTYGDVDTQLELIGHHGNGQRIMLGRNPYDLDAPAIAFDADLNLICRDILPVKAGAYNSMDGIRLGARNRKHAAKLARDTAETAKFMSQEELARFNAQLDAALAPVKGASEAATTGGVTRGHFTAKVSDKPGRKEPKSPPPSAPVETGNVAAFDHMMSFKKVGGSGTNQHPPRAATGKE